MVLRCDRNILVIATMSVSAGITIAENKKKKV
jgi:hypothetical protein